MSPSPTGQHVVVDTLLMPTRAGAGPLQVTPAYAFWRTGRRGAIVVPTD